jgi:hypothetical protein
MYYDEKKGRYMIAGEEEASDEDDVAPPPTGMRGKPADSKPEEEKKEK